MSQILCLIARCQSCGLITAGACIDDGAKSSKELGRIVQKALRGYSVAVVEGPVEIRGCNCATQYRTKELFQ